MSKLTLDEAIKHCLEVAEQEECFINYPHSDIVLGDLDIESRKHYIAEQKQLAEWLMEMKVLREENEQLKRILKVAISDIYKKCSCENSDCDICETETACDYDNRFTWEKKRGI